MENENLTPEEELKAENEILKLKLEMEHGMTQSDSELPPEVENQWLNHIYNYEAKYKNAKPYSVYELIGKPDYKKANELSENEFELELKKLMALMEENGIQLSTCCDYPSEKIYRFITEELFLEKTVKLEIEGMMHCYIYEEFYPNHDYDLRSFSKELIEKIFSKSWDVEYSVFTMPDEIKFNGNEISKKIFSEKIFQFQECYEEIELINSEVVELNFNIEAGNGFVAREFEAVLKLNDGTIQTLKSKLSLSYLYEWDWWTLKEISFDRFDL